MFQLDELEAVDVKYNKIIYKFQLKNIQIGHFWSQIWGSLFLQQNLQQDKFKDSPISNITIFFLNSIPKTNQIRHFWSKIAK